MKLGFKILGCTNLANSEFAPVAFGLSSTGPVDQLEASAGPGFITVWVQPPPGTTQSYYMVLLENGVSLPAIFFAQCATAARNSQVVIYGGGLTGQVAAVTGTTTLPATLLNDYSVAVTLPGTPGVYPITVKLNGQPVMGTVTLTVVDATNLPVVNAITGLAPTPYSTFQITGKGLSTNSLAFLDSTQLQVFDAAADGTSLVLRLPDGVTSGQLRVITAGASSPPIQLNVQTDRFSYTPAVTQPIRPYAWDTNSTERFSYLPSATPLRVYAWDTNNVERFTYLPVGITRVSAP